MTTVFHEAIAWYNLPMTALLCLLVLYWMVASFGAFGDGFDADIHADADLDVDGHDVDPDAHHGGGAGIGEAFTALMRFVNMDQVPVMIFVSVLVVSMWMLSIIGNYFFTGAGNVLAALLVLGGSFFISLFVAKAATAPMAKVMRKMGEADKETREPIVGRSGVVRSGSVTADFGQVEIEMRGAPLIINARLRDGNARLKKGDECFVIDEDDDKGIYYVKSI